MSQVDFSHYIPRSLDKSDKFLFWDFDVAAVAILSMLVGLGTDHSISGVVVGLGLAYFYSKLKAGHHQGMSTHILYWWTGMPQPTELPPSHLRELNG
jgi:conjugal transfer pilus assembly protein TraL